MNDFDIQLRLIDAWHTSKRYNTAIQRCETLLQSHPQSVQLHLKLIDIAIDAHRMDYAHTALARAFEAVPDDPEIHRMQDVLHGVLNARLMRAQHRKRTLPAENRVGKLDLSDQFSVSSHRGGWQVAIEALFPLHKQGGVLFDGFLEHHFIWQHDIATYHADHDLRNPEKSTARQNRIEPYQRPWIGFLHNPPNMPHWFHGHQRPQVLLEKTLWQDSLAHCAGLFTLSDYLADWLRSETGLPVNSLFYPTELDVPQFDFELFLANSCKKIIQVGWWMRRQTAIYQLPLAGTNPAGYEKTKLVTQFFDRAHHYLRELMALEQDQLDLDIPDEYAQNTREMQFQSPTDFDSLLQQNIVFLSLYDASGSTTVIECIARATPLLINRLPAIVEYLGEEYPFYYDSLDEAAAKALDFDLVEETHHYLKACPVRPKLSPAYFRQSFVASDIYRSI